MSKDTLRALIEHALFELEHYVVKYEKGSPSKSIIDTKKVLLLLKENAEDYPSLNNRLLRAMKDISIAAVKEYEGTPLEEAIINVKRELWNSIPGFAGMEPLRLDFGKGNPI